MSFLQTVPRCNTLSSDIVNSILEYWHHRPNCPVVGPLGDWSCHCGDVLNQPSRVDNNVFQHSLLIEVYSEGKIRYLGLSDCSVTTIRRASTVHQISAYEVEYSPFALEIEAPDIGVLVACRENGIAVVTYSPIDRGVLSGRITLLGDLPENDSRRMFPKYSTENFPKINQLVDKLKQIAAFHSCSAAKACIAWVRAQGDDIIPIPGTKTIKHL